MPQLRDITVHVTDAKGVELEEWAVQHLRNQHKVSAYIQAQSDMPFRVTVQAQIPYTCYELPRGTTKDPSIESSRSSRDSSYGCQQDEAYEYTSQAGNCKPRRQRHSRSQHSRGGFESKALEDDSRATPNIDIQSSPTRTQASYPKAPPFDFLATLYLDGRSIPERKVVIYLNPEHEDFGPGGKSHLKSRWVQTKDGGIQEHAWIFHDVGIDTILSKLELVKPGKDVEESEVAMIAAIKRAGISAEFDVEKEERKKIGQIEVQIMRVVLGEKIIDYQFRPRHQEGDNEDVHMEETDPQLTHTTGFALTKLAVSNQMPVVNYAMYDKEERVYATFKFFYRSQETLEKLIPAFPRISRPTRKPGHIDTTFTNKTPLSISRGSKPMNKWASSAANSYEDRLRQKTFEENTNIEFHFDDENRRIELKARKEGSLAEDAGDSMPLKAPSPLKKNLIIIAEQDSVGAKGTKVANFDVFADLDAPRMSKEAIERPGLASNLSRQDLTQGSHQDTHSACTSKPRRPSKTPLNLDRSRLATYQPRQRDSGPSPEASTEASDDTPSPRSFPNTPTQPYESRLRPSSGFRDTSSTASNTPVKLTKVVYTDFRQGFNSDADDEHGLNDSDLETEMGEDEHDADDDVVPSQDKDDEGLHKRISEITIKGKGKRRYDGESATEKEVSDTDAHRLSLSEQALVDDAGDEMQTIERKGKSMIAAGQAMKEQEQHSKRLKKNDQGDTA